MSEALSESQVNQLRFDKRMARELDILRRKANVAAGHAEHRRANATIPTAYRQEAINHFDRRLAEEKRNAEPIEVKQLNNMMTGMHAMVGPRMKGVEKFMPPKKTLFHDLYAKKRIKLRHVIALQNFIVDLAKCKGSSKKLTCSMGERVDQPRQLKDPDKYLTPTSNDHQRRVERIYGRLHDHEKKLIRLTLIEYLSRTRGQKFAEVDMTEIGRAYSGYGSKNTQYAAGVGRLHSLLDSLAEMYNIA